MIPKDVTSIIAKIRKAEGKKTTSQQKGKHIG